MLIHCNLATLLLVLTLDRHTITGGHEAVPHSRPYMVLLERYMSSGKIKYCPGFLLNEDLVMTAVHCQAKYYTALLGVHSVHSRNQIHRISMEQAFPHQHFNRTSYVNDVMLLKLSSKAKFNMNVRPIALADRDHEFLPRSCVISGWGRPDRNSKYISPKLMEVSVTLVDSEVCSMENFYCSQGETGPGDGDSGGPLVCEDGKVYGVI
ncbi:granzyme G-like [Archocentrus centrarchus]|uniref:granzyme G-like n=1 Tax=Archocentrus centrarchus TaxID=63155 RepID=UPI0011E9F0D4|nr:granzyme G-like [Archocentrus centrarchus]